LASLATGDLPALGPANAPVTLVVFSDFECPYCAQFTGMVRNEILPAEGERVRLVFRHFPLPMHPWARRAAEAAACAYEQKNESFWSLHDFFFDHQQELTPENLQQKVLEHAHGMPGLDLAKFESCWAQQRTATNIEREVAFANKIGIHATLTLFLNGKETPIVAPEQLRTLIRQLSHSK
jgi:protein-disulfide isomerase